MIHIIVHQDSYISWSVSSYYSSLLRPPNRKFFCNIIRLPRACRASLRRRFDLFSLTPVHARPNAYCSSTRLKTNYMPSEHATNVFSCTLDTNNPLPIPRRKATTATQSVQSLHLTYHVKHRSRRAMNLSHESRLDIVDESATNERVISKLPADTSPPIIHTPLDTLYDTQSDTHLQSKTPSCSEVWNFED